MADEASSEPAKKGGIGLKTIVVILMMLVGEAAVIVGVIMFLGKPSEVQGSGLVYDDSAEGEKPVEVPVLHEKFTNNSTGRIWVWDTEILVQVKAKHQLGVQTELESRLAEIRTGLSSIWAGAQHAYFNEPGRETLSRQATAYLRGIFGKDPTGEDRIQAVLIPKSIGFPADY